MIAPNPPCKPNTALFNKVTIKGARQAMQMFGPARQATARAVRGQLTAAEVVKRRHEAKHPFAP